MRAKCPRASAKWLSRGDFDTHVLLVTSFSALCSQVVQMSDEASRELHAEAQEQLRHYFMGRAVEEKAQRHREALMAQINTNIEQLMSMYASHFVYPKRNSRARSVTSRFF